MFCMNCGLPLPEGAKFCMNCGTPQGSVSPTETNQTKTINLDGMHAFVPAMCPNCNSHMKVDSLSKVSRCDNCGTECLVQEAIKTLTVKGNVQVGNATINVNGSNTASLLKRVEIMLGDRDFRGAMNKCDKLLDSDPTNGNIYFFMLMADLECAKKTDLARQKENYDHNQYYIKAMQYGDDSLKSELSEYLNSTKAILQREKEELERREALRLEKIAKESAKERAKQEATQKNPKVGDWIYFGTFNKKRVWWTVLCVENRKALIISSHVIASLPYHQTNKNITWEKSTLRSWLNNEFIQSCFTQEEQTRILPCNLNNDRNPRYRTPGGANTIDKVFLLSINEYLTYYDEARYYNSRWWLRSPGGTRSFAAYVDYNGSVYMGGFCVTLNYDIKPVLWINLDT